MISNVIQYGTSLNVRDESGTTVSNLSVGYGTEVEGWSEDFIVLRNGNHVYTVDERGYQLGFVQLPDSEQRVQGVTAQGFSVRNGRLVQRYNESCRPAESYSV